MIISQQLQNKEFRFVLIKKGTKAPYENNWQSTNNYPYFNHKIENAECVGILCGRGNLIVLDIDDVKYLEEFDKKTDTFSVKTGSGKRHYYFICEESFERSYYVLGDKVGELRVRNSQVLIPNCIHPNGNKYEVFCDKEIRKVNKDELRNILGDILIRNGEADTTRSGKEWGEVCSMINAGYNFDDCDREMRLLGYTKWVEAGQGYRIRTYCKALETIKLNINKPKSI